MLKGTTVEQVREAARITQELGMQAGFFILLGYPDETTSDIRETINFLKETRPDVVGTSVAFPIKGTEFYERVENRIIPNENWSSRNQNKLLFKGKYPRLYYWFAARWLVKEVNVDKMWRMPKRPYMRIVVESAKAVVARAELRSLMRRRSGASIPKSSFRPGGMRKRQICRGGLRPPTTVSVPTSRAVID